MYAEHGPDDMKSEYPSCIEECFHNSLQGSYFKTELTKARMDKRIGLPMPYDPSRPVNTFWDIGMDDENCIWFHQTDGVRHRMIDFHRNSCGGRSKSGKLLTAIEAAASAGVPAWCWRSRIPSGRSCSRARRPPWQSGIVFGIRKKAAEWAARFRRCCDDLLVNIA
jgi:hypothetical protein